MSANFVKLSSGEEDEPVWLNLGQMQAVTQKRGPGGRVVIEAASGDTYELEGESAKAFLATLPVQPPSTRVEPDPKLVEHLRSEIQDALDHAIVDLGWDIAFTARAEEIQRLFNRIHPPETAK